MFAVCQCAEKYVHTAVGEGQCVCVAGHTLLLTVVGAGSRSHRITDVDIVRVDGLPAGCVSGRMSERNTEKKKEILTTQHVFLTDNKSSSFDKQIFERLLALKSSEHGRPARADDAALLTHN